MFIGKAVATPKALQQAPLYYRALQRDLNSQLATPQDHPQGSQEKYKSQIAIDNQMRRDLTWWASLDKQLMESPICMPQPHLIIESDASHLGWGARCKESTGGCWSVVETSYHINYQELLAAFLALQTFASQHKITVLLRMDNVSAVTYVNQKVGTHSTLLCNLALEIWKWWLHKQITLQAEHRQANAM